MTNEKFKSEIETLNKFFNIYCQNKHQNQTRKKYNITYNNTSFQLDTNLCNECKELLEYAIQKLQNCPYKEKPKCRKCPNPCYDKQEYKQMAKIMRYSGMKLGLTKAAKKLKSLFKS